MRTSFIGPFLLYSQQQNEGDSPGGQIHFVVRADDEKTFYLSPAIAPGELLSEIVPNVFLLQARARTTQTTNSP